MHLGPKTIVAVLLLAVIASDAPGQEEYAGWPKSWVDSYRRFEAFMVAQDKNVPASDLEILPNGGIQSSLRREVDGMRHTSLVFFKDGVEVLAMALNGSSSNADTLQSFPVGVYALCLQTSDEIVGYQFRHPLKWIRTVRAKDQEDREQENVQVEMIEQPQPAEAFWPNDRLLRYWDFQVMPHINPLDFIQENNKANPKVTLAVTNTGVIQREKLEESLESLLGWRIYYDGKLIEKGSAANDIHHVRKEGLGTYVAFVGLDGPTGFMPVSNLLQFPLFPERDGSMRVLPSADAEGFPNFLSDALAPDQMNRLREFKAPGKAQDGYSKAAIYGLGSVGRISDTAKETLISLWSHWAWSLDLVKADPTSDITRINLASEAE